MPLFLVKLWAIPWVRKAVFYALIAAAIALAFRWWLNAHDRVVYEQGKKAMAVQLEKEKEKEWADKAKTLEEQAKVLDLKAAEIQRDRQSITKVLDERLRTVRTLTQANSAAVAMVPDSNLDAALRAVSRELESANQ